MKLILTDTAELLNKKLSNSQRGILCVIMLIKESDSKMTLAKFKTICKIKDCQDDLIVLHEMKLIEWSGYSNAIKSSSNKPFEEDGIKVIDFMNNLYKRGFKYNTYKTSITARLKENSLNDIKLVISNRYEVWKDDSTMKIHLNPTTIFRKSKFDTYLEMAKSNGIGKGILEAHSLNLSNGEEITLEISKEFKDSVFYSIRTYQLSSLGERRGLGVKSNRRGKDIKNMVSLEHRKLNRGEQKEYCYIYLED